MITEITASDIPECVRVIRSSFQTVADALGFTAENALLRSWYESHGFAHTGTRKFDFFPFTCGYMEARL